MSTLTALALSQLVLLVVFVVVLGLILAACWRAFERWQQYRALAALWEAREAMEAALWAECTAGAAPQPPRNEAIPVTSARVDTWNRPSTAA